MNDTVLLLHLDVVFRRRKDVAREGKFEHRQRVLLRIADDVVANFHASLVDDHEREDVNARRDFIGKFLPRSVAARRSHRGLGEPMRRNRRTLPPRKRDKSPASRRN